MEAVVVGPLRLAQANGLATTGGWMKSQSKVTETVDSLSFTRWEKSIRLAPVHSSQEIRGAGK